MDRIELFFKNHFKGSSSSRTAKRGDIAFWRYDRYPFLLWGEILKLKDGGTRAYVKGYSGWFKIQFSMPPAAAKGMIQDLESITTRRNEEVGAANDAAIERMRKLLFENHISPNGYQQSAIERIVGR